VRVAGTVARPAQSLTDTPAILTGNRNTALHAMGAALRRTGASYDAVLAALLITNRERVSPPLPEHEIARIAANVARYTVDDVAAAIDFASIFEEDPDAPKRVGALVEDIARRVVPPVRRYPSGFPLLDAKIAGGISTRQLCILLGPPAAGKSAFAVALAFALQTHVPVLYASTELESHELAARVAAPLIGCKWTDIVSGRIDLRQVAHVVKDLRIRIIGSDELARGDDALIMLEQEARAMSIDVTPVIVLDYLQDLARGTDERSVRGKIGDLASRLRALSQRLDCAVVAVSSVSRAYYGSASQGKIVERATEYLAAAKESGDVDYAAAVVLYLDVGEEGDTDYRDARIAIAKSRHGSTGFIGARFFGATGRWIESPEALEGMSVNGRVERREAEQAESADAKLLATAKQNPSAGWRELRTLSGLRGTRADEARARLIASGILTEERHTYFDSLHRMQNKLVLRIVAGLPVRAEVPKEIDPALDGFARNTSMR
jgi:KaiC/GvpD/RAD55 family RecA-like ATPase